MRGLAHAGAVYKDLSNRSKNLTLEIPVTDSHARLTIGDRVNYSVGGNGCNLRIEAQEGGGCRKIDERSISPTSSDNHPAFRTRPDQWNLRRFDG